MHDGECHRAGFLASRGLGTVIFLGYTGVLLSITFTLLLRALCFPYKSEGKDAAISTAEPPPPYASSNINTTSTSSPSSQPPIARSLSTPMSFLYATILLAGLILVDTTLAFCLQNLRYCPKSDPSQEMTYWMFFGWFLYSALVLYSCSGFVAWSLLFLRLGGIEFSESILLDVFALVVLSLVVLPFAALFGIVQVCWRWYYYGDLRVESTSPRNSTKYTAIVSNQDEK